MRFSNYTHIEIEQYLLLRAIEWSNFPNYLSQPLVPILLMFYPWYLVIPSVLGVNVLWSLLRYKFINAEIACLVVTPIRILTWPSAIGCAIALLMHEFYGTAFLALIWPAIVGYFSIPAKYGVIEREIGSQLGFKENE